MNYLTVKEGEIDNNYPPSQAEEIETVAKVFSVATRATRQSLVSCIAQEEEEGILKPLFPIPKKIIPHQITQLRPKTLKPRDVHTSEPSLLRCEGMGIHCSKPLLPS